MVIFIGTKGQLIKVASVMKELDLRHVDYLYVQTDQHPSMNRQLEKSFGIRPPDISLSNRVEDLSSPKEVVSWFATCLLKVRHIAPVLRTHNLIVTQGDTLTTLMASMVAHHYRLRLAHIEAGLRSYSIIHPFPEELIRRVVSKYAHYLFAPSDWATSNLQRETGHIVNTKQNTVYDILAWIKTTEKGPSCIVSAIHRQETIYNPHRFTKAVDVIHTASRIAPVKYILHKPSEVQLKKLNLYKGLLQNQRIEVLQYQDYVTFMRMVARSVFVISDGGGLQEETYFLNVPCLLLRNRTEREIGLGITSFLSEFKSDRIEYFLKHYTQFRRKEAFQRLYPSRIIVDELLSACNTE
jgi:UDP-N-acetylglucosamine 2-epimerase (non-hydrolysing)